MDEEDLAHTPSLLKGNAVTNPSFESDLSGWWSWQGELSRVSDPDAPDGKYVARVTWVEGTSFTIDDEPDSVKSTVEGARYSASALVRAASAASVGRPIVLRLTERDASGKVVSEVSSPPLQLTESFQKITMSITATGAQHTLGLRLSHGQAGQGSAFDVDLVSLEQDAPGAKPREGAKTSEPAEQRPFDPSHPVYQPIPDDCPLYVHSSKIVGLISSKFRKLAFDTGAESPAVYVGQPNDPVWSLTIQGRQFRVHAPANIRQGTGSDYPLVVLDRSSPDYNGHPVEYRLWQASVNPKSRTVSSNGGGVGVYANDGRTLDDIGVQKNKPRRALGMAEIYGQNTGSGNSYTVGMIRPADVRRGRIDHAIRVAIGYPHPKRWFWPATRTETWAKASDDHCPMGCRIFLDKSVDVKAVADRVAARLSDEKNKAFARMVLVALQEYGMIALDGSGGNNVYLEGDATANWQSLIGRKNSSGTYNDIARAIAAELPWERLRVADESVFDRYGR